ncbi:MAG: AI-2E family transporter, partial [Aestuariivirga sp.]
GQSKSRPSVTNVLLAAGIFLGLVLCYFIALPFLPALVWSFTLAVLFVPLDAKIRKKLGSPGLSAGATTAIVGVIVVVPAILVIGTLLNETVKSAPLITSMANSATWTRVTADHPWLAPATSWLNARLNIQELIQAATSWLAGWSGSFVKGSITGLVSLLLTFYFLFYLLRDRSSAVATVANMLPLSASEFALLGDRIVNTIFASVYGTATVAILQGGLGGLMFWWLDLPAPLFWGVVMGLLAVVPFLGAFVIWGPTAIVLALSGEFVAAIQLTVWGVVVVGLVDNVLYPILVGKRLMLHTVPSFIAVAGGLVLFGPHGIVLGPVIVAGSQTLLEIWRKRAIAG